MEEEREDVVEGWGSLHPGCCVWVGVPYIHYNYYLFVSQPHGVSAMPLELSMMMMVWMLVMLMVMMEG